MSQIQYKITRALGALVLLLIAVQPITAQSPVSSAEASTQKTNAARPVMDDKTLRCSLQEGETTFILPIPKPSMLDGFKFVNENLAIRGELKIAVSDSCLPANDTRWNSVNGTVAFAHKRLFNLSMLGVEAKYVKLSFHVVKDGPGAAITF